MAAPVAYPLKGLELDFDRLAGLKSPDPIVASRMQQGELDYRASTSAQMQAVIAQWTELLEYQ